MTRTRSRLVLPRWLLLLAVAVVAALMSVPSVALGAKHKKHKHYHHGNYDVVYQGSGTVNRSQSSSSGKSSIMESFDWKTTYTDVRLTTKPKAQVFGIQTYGEGGGVWTFNWSHTNLRTHTTETCKSFGNLEPTGWTSPGYNEGGSIVGTTAHNGSVPLDVSVSHGNALFEALASSGNCDQSLWGLDANAPWDGDPLDAHVSVPKGQIGKHKIVETIDSDIAKLGGANIPDGMSWDGKVTFTK